MQHETYEQGVLIPVPVERIDPQAQEVSHFSEAMLKISLLQTERKIDWTQTSLELLAQDLEQLNHWKLLVEHELLQRSVA